ncbi:MAG: enoyl-CoA hydratase-related protein [Desulfatirhabdiaceae bacterium]
MIDSNIILTERQWQVAIIKLNSPDAANALNKNMFISLTDVLEEFRWDDDVRVVVITGEGEKVFCAGIDLKERAQKNQTELLRERETVIRPFYMCLGNFPKPVIAADNGQALGGGAELALSCDIRIASSHAKFGQAEIKWGMIPSCGACQRLRLIVGMGIAKEIIFSGKILAAEEAYRLGIYNRLVDNTQLMDEALDLASQIADNSPIAVRQAKKVLDSGANLWQALEMDFEASKECFFSGDAFSKPKNF